MLIIGALQFMQGNVTEKNNPKKYNYVYISTI